MNEAKEVDAKASSVIAVPGGGGITGKSDVIGAIATGTKDTPAVVAAKVCADGGVEVQKEVVTAVASEGGTPAAKKQKVAGEVTPPDAKETKMCEVCTKRELKAGETPNECDRCGKTAVCDFCVIFCAKCDDLICDECRDCRDASGGWDNDISYCEICEEYKCGKCGGNEFRPLCGFIEGEAEGMVCCECVDRAETRGHF